MWHRQDEKKEKEENAPLSNPLAVQNNTLQSKAWMPHLQTTSIFCYHKLKWWLWDEQMKTMYSVPSCFAEPNLHPFPRTAHFTNIRRRFHIVSNCHHSFPSTECLWKRPGTHSHGPLKFLWAFSFRISWAFTEEGYSVRENYYSAIWSINCLIRILKRIHL